MTTQVPIITAINSLVPNAQVSVVGNDVNQITWIDPSVAPVTNDEILAEQARLEAQVPLEQCKQQASQLLYATDWTTIPDVANPANTPYLMNQADFIAYRNIVRQLAVNPVANPVFPDKPTEQWSQA